MLIISTDKIEYYDAAESIRQRPGLWIGGKGPRAIFYCLRKILPEITGLAKNDQAINFFVDCKGNYKITISGDFVVEDIAVVTTSEDSRIDEGLFFLARICAVCRFVITTDNNKWELLFESGKFKGGTPTDIGPGGNSLEISFVLDPAFFTHFPDYYQFCDFFLEFAMLNPGIAIVLVDSVGGSTNNYHFPDGLSRQLHTMTSNTPYVRLFYFSRWENNNFYQIGVSMKSDWRYDEPNIAIYTGDDRTSPNGSLLDGVVSGIIQAKNEFIKSLGGKADQPRRSKLSLTCFMNAFVIVAHLKTKDNNYNYSGSMRGDNLDMPEIKKEVRKLVNKEVKKYFTDNHETMRKRFWNI